MAPQLEVSGPAAARFLRTLPRMKTNRRDTWIVQSGAGLRTTQVKPRGSAVRVGGLERLRVLERMAPKARSLRVFADDTTGASGWVLVFDDCRFHLVISPEVWRGFSGEGQALTALTEDWESSVNRVRAQLGWQAAIALDELAERAGISAESATNVLAALGVRGLGGFDVDAGAWFHRELPFDLDAIEKMQPRLKAARKLVEAEAVRFASDTEAWVTSGGIEHRVRLDGDDARCTCPWYAKHRGERGPCKHVLAVRLLQEG